MADSAPRNVIRDRLRREKRAVVDNAVGKGESWASKVLNGEQGVNIDDLPVLLRVLGLRVVDANLTVVDPDIAKALLVFGRKAINEVDLLSAGEPEE